MLALLLVAVSLGLSNFAASVGIGASGVDTRMRLRVGVVFGFFIATAVYGLIRARLDTGAEPATGPGPQRMGRLLVTGLALSIDNLTVGFALGALHVSLLVAVIVIGAVSVTLSLLGLELGHRISIRIGRGEVLGGLVLIGVGAAVLAGVL